MRTPACIRWARRLSPGLWAGVPPFSCSSRSFSFAPPKWVRVSVYATDGLLYFEHDPKQPRSEPQMLALRELESIHGLRLFDEVRQVPVETIRPRWAARFPAA